MKKKYEKPVMEINKFDCEDIITTSSIKLTSYGFAGSFDGTLEGINSVDL